MENKLEMQTAAIIRLWHVPRCVAAWIAAAIWQQQKCAATLLMERANAFQKKVANFAV